MLALTFSDQVKLILKRNKMSIKLLAEQIEEKTGKKMSRQNLTQKLARNNFQEEDMRLIAEVLGCRYQLSIMEELSVGETSTVVNQAFMDAMNQAAKVGGLPGIESEEEANNSTLTIEEKMEEEVLKIKMAEVEAKKLAEKKAAKKAEAEATKKAEAEAAKKAEAEAAKKAAAPKAKATKKAKKSDEIADFVQLSFTESGEVEETAANVVVPEKVVKAAKSKVKAEVKPEAKTKPKAEVKPEVKPEVKVEAKAEAKPEAKAEAKAEAKPEVKVEAKAEAKPEAKPEAKAKAEAKPETKPASVKPATKVVTPKPIAKAAAAKPEAKTEVKPEVKAEVKPTTRLTGKIVPNKKPEAETTTVKTSRFSFFKGLSRREAGEVKPDINPFTGVEYKTNSVRTHPKKVGYVQVYDRKDCQWADMTEWAFIAYQERKLSLLGKKYEEPTYLD